MNTKKTFTKLNKVAKPIKNKGLLTPKEDLINAKKIKKHLTKLSKLKHQKKLIQNIKGKRILGQRLDSMTEKNLKKKDIVHAAKVWTNK